VFADSGKMPEVCGAACVPQEDIEIVCHYCGTKSDIIELCPVCNGRISYRGAGTERIEEIVKKIFPEAEVLRADADAGGITRKFSE